MKTLTSADHLEMFRLLAKARAIQETMIINRTEVNGPLFTGLGQEAIAVGVTYALHKAGILEGCPINFDHRGAWSGFAALDEYVNALKESDTSLIDELLRNHFMSSTGGCRGRDGNIHIPIPTAWNKLLPFICSDMGRLTGVLGGMVKEYMRQENWHTLPPKERFVGVTMVGDGASNQGAVHEAMVWFARYELPVICIINNNQIALFTDPAEEHGNSKLVKRAFGYGKTLGIEVDGDNVGAVALAMDTAIQRAQQGIPVLLVANTYRRTGHNEDQIRRASESDKLKEKRNFFDVKHIFGLDEKGLIKFREECAREPLVRAKEYVIQHKHATPQECDAILRVSRGWADAVVERVLKEPHVTLDEDRRDRSISPPAVWKSPLEQPAVADETQRLKYFQAFSWIVGTLMKEDERVSYFGEDVASEEGGVLALTKGLLEAFGKDRISNTPITEEANAAAAAGMAFAGGKPITEFQFATFFSNAFSLLFVIAPQWYQKGMRAGFVTVYPSGIVHTGGSGHYHEAWVERYLPLGIVIVAPSNAYDLVGLMRAAHEYDGPVAILIQISAAGSAEFRSDVPIDPYVIPFGKAKIIREGADCTVAAYGAACVAAAKNEADAMMKEEGINVEVIDLRTVEPWDKETLLTSVEKTGYLILMHEDSVDGGMGERIIGGLMKEIRFFKSLKAPAFVVGALYPCVPSAKVLIWDRLPYELVVIGKDKLHRSQRLRKEIIRVRSKAEARGENDG